MDNILGALGGLAGGGSSSPIAAILQMLLQQQGGLGGLVNNMQQGGLGDIVSSWVSTGGNLPVSPGQLSGIFSPDQLSQLTERFGGDSDAAQSALAEHLPNVVDRLTPAGVLPDNDAWTQNAGDLLGGLLK